MTNDCVRQRIAALRATRSRACPGGMSRWHVPVARIACVRPASVPLDSCDASLVVDSQGGAGLAAQLAG